MIQYRVGQKTVIYKLHSVAIETGAECSGIATVDKGAKSSNNKIPHFGGKTKVERALHKNFNSFFTGHASLFVKMEMPLSVLSVVRM